MKNGLRARTPIKRISGAILTSILCVAALSACDRFQEGWKELKAHLPGQADSPSSAGGGDNGAGGKEEVDLGKDLDALAKRVRNEAEGHASDALLAAVPELAALSGAPDLDLHLAAFASQISSFGSTVAPLEKASRDKGVYLGLGLEENYLHVGLLQPTMAIHVAPSVDAYAVHLLWRAALELSPSRQAFFSLVMGLDTSTGKELPKHATPQVVLDRVASWRFDENQFAESHQKIRDEITRSKVPLSQGLQKALLAAHKAYAVSQGPSSAPQGPSSAPQGPSTAPQGPLLALLTAADADGYQRSFLATEEAYLTVRKLWTDGRAVILTGTFDPGVLSAVGRILRNHGTSLSVAYLAQHEERILARKQWAAWADRLLDLPFSANAVLLRLRPQHKDVPTRIHVSQPASLRLLLKLKPVTSYADLVRTR
jgi:hypothetical protein